VWPCYWSVLTLTDPHMATASGSPTHGPPADWHVFSPICLSEFKFYLTLWIRVLRKNLIAPLLNVNRFIRLRLKCDGKRGETRFRLSAKGKSPFKSAGASVQSTTGSQGVRISGSNAGYTMFRGSVKGTSYAVHSTVSSSLPLPCVTVCHHISAGLPQHFVPVCEHRTSPTYFG
jgi:hypothetical protein